MYKVCKKCTKNVQKMYKKCTKNVQGVVADSQPSISISTSYLLPPLPSPLPYIHNIII